MVHGAWLSPAIYYRHQQVDKALTDLSSLEDNNESMGNEIIMRALTRSSSLTSQQMGEMDFGDQDGEDDDDDDDADSISQDGSIGRKCAEGREDPDEQQGDNNLDEEDDNDSTMTGALKEAVADLSHISSSVNQFILSFSVHGSLHFAHPPNSRSSSMTLEPTNRSAFPNCGSLRLEPKSAVNSSILVHESRMFDALALLENLSDVEGLAFEQAHAKVLRRVREEIQRIDTIKTLECHFWLAWANLLYIPIKIRTLGLIQVCFRRIHPSAVSHK